MREVMPLFKSAKGKKEELKARTPSKLFAQYCLSLDREMTKVK
jgi:hypothetical protein